MLKGVLYLCDNMVRISGIYYIKNIIINKYYVGQSVDIYKRWHRHKYLLNNDKHNNIFPQKDWNRYGKDAFVFCVIKFCKKKYLNRLGKLYIKTYNVFDSGYNYTIGGDFNPMESLEIRKKISQSMTGDKNHFYNKKHSLLSETEMSKAHNTSRYFRVSKEYGEYKNVYR